MKKLKRELESLNKQLYREPNRMQCEKKNVGMES